MNSPVVYTCLFAIFISLLIFFFDNGYKKANRFLAGFLFFSAIFSILMYVYVFSHSTKWVAIFVTSIPSTFFLIGPFSFFYIRSIVRDNPSLSKIDYLHFVLFIYCFTGTIPFLFSSWEYKLFVGSIIKEDISNFNILRINVLFPYKLNQGIRPFQITYYVIFQWKLIRRYFKVSERHVENSAQYFIMKKWLIIYCSIFTLLGFGFSSGIICRIFTDNKADFLALVYKMVVITIAGYITLLFTLFLFPQVIYGLPIINKVKQEGISDIDLETENETTAMVEPTDIAIPQTINSKPSLFFTEVYMKEIEIEIEKSIQEKKYLESDFTINQLSVYTNIPTHHLSYYFKNALQQKFIEWRTNLRINYSITLIEQNALDNLTFPALANKLGFSSYNTFIKAFKAKTNCSPSEYLANIKL